MQGHSVKHQYKGFRKNEGKDNDQPFIMAICTSLMSRVHRYIQQSKAGIQILKDIEFQRELGPTI